MTSFNKALTIILILCTCFVVGFQVSVFHNKQTITAPPSPVTMQEKLFIASLGAKTKEELIKKIGKQTYNETLEKSTLQYLKKDDGWVYAQLEFTNKEPPLVGGSYYFKELSDGMYEKVYQEWNTLPIWCSQMKDSQISSFLAPVCRDDNYPNENNGNARVIDTKSGEVIDDWFYL